ncbi:MAG: TonB-dependent receptor [Rhizomicrobium sp.]
MLNGSRRSALLLSSALAVLAMLGFGGAVQAADQTYQFDIPSETLGQALTDFSRASSQQIVFSEEVTAGRSTKGLHGRYTAAQALDALLAGSGLHVETNSSGVMMVRPKNVQAASNEGAANRNGDIETVVVTGTNIPGVSPSSPVQTIDRDAINRAGYATTQDVIRSLPQNFGGGVNENATVITGGPANPGYVASANLRGLGSNATLVLLNGHRLAPTGLSGSVDLGAIPLSIVNRVEVLTDGASAIYGSDAVGGVINFFTDKSFDGARTDLEYGTDSDGDVSDVRLSQTVGKDWGAGNAFGTFEYHDRDPLLARDRPMFSALQPGQVITPSQRRYSGFGSVNQEISSGLEIWATALYSQQTNQSTDFFAGTQLKYDLDELSLTGGAKYALPGDWTADISGFFGSTNVHATGSFLTGAAIAPQKIFNRSAGGDLQANGTLLDGWAGPIRTAVGVSFRHDWFGYDPGGGGIPSASRDTFSGFGEIDVPLTTSGNEFALVRAAELNVAVRYDNYSDFGSTWNPKIGISTTPIDGLKLRASWGTSFRAPDFYELYLPNISFVVDLPDATVPSGATRSLFFIGGNPNLGPEKAETFTAGIDISPELFGGIHGALTFYDVHFKDRVGTGVQNFINGLRDEGLEGPQIVQRNPSPQALATAIANSTLGVISLVGPFAPADIHALILGNNLNLTSTHQSGLDLSLDKGWDAGPAKIIASMNASYLFTDSQRVTVFTPQSQLKNTAFNPPSFRARAGLTTIYEPVDVSVFVNYSTNYSDTTVVPVGTVGSYTTLDMQLATELGVKGGDELLDNLRLAFSVRNLFDQRPPRLAGVNGLNYPYGYDPANADPIGRFISLRLTKDF